MADVLILVGSESDKPRIEPAFEILTKAGFSYEFYASSAHRQPEQTGELVKNARKKGFKSSSPGRGCRPRFRVRRVADGSARHRSPVRVGPLNGLDAAARDGAGAARCPVATVGIDNAKKRAHLAIRILKG